MSYAESNSQPVLWMGRGYVETMMTSSFHRFAGVAPASWQTYARLASLAKEKYGLQVAAPSLPERKTSQGTLWQTTDLRRPHVMNYCRAVVRRPRDTADRCAQEMQTNCRSSSVLQI